MINRLRLALALALPLAAFVQSGSSVGALPALLPQEEGYEEQRAAAAGLVQEGSWQLALELYTRIDLSGLAEEDRRWVSFRLADLEWRSAAASRNPDPSRLDAGQRALRELAAPDARPADRDRVWAEVQEAAVKTLLGKYYTPVGAVRVESAEELEEQTSENMKPILNSIFAHRCSLVSSAMLFRRFTRRLIHG